MNYQHILVPVDGSEYSSRAVQHAVELAKIFNSTITIVQVLTLDPLIATEYIKTGKSNEVLDRARNYILDNLNKLAQNYQQDNLNLHTQLLEDFSIVQGITQAAKDLNADLVVMGSHGRTGLSKFLLGSVAQRALLELPLPVLIVR